MAIGVRRFLHGATSGTAVNHDGLFRALAMARARCSTHEERISSRRRHCDVDEEEQAMSKISFIPRLAVVLSVGVTVVLLATPAWCRGGHSGGPAFGASIRPLPTAHVAVPGRIRPYQYTPPPAAVSPYGPTRTYQYNPPPVAVSPHGPSGAAAASPAYAAASGLSNICATRSGSCPMQRQVGTPCQCKDTQGHVFDGIARYVVR
jgi:hypothetical protein